MKCVICKEDEADDVFWHYSYTYPIEPITCKQCRLEHYPDFMNNDQYKRYWDAFHVKWRRENDMCDM